MGSEISIQNQDSFLIICPECLKHITLFKLSPPFILYWCECFRENKTKKLLDICQYKKISYINYIKSIKDYDFSKIDINSFSEETNCQIHPDKKEIYIGFSSLQIKCEQCKNPGEKNIRYY